MQRKWREIPDFENYEISDQAEVYNAATGREIRHSRTPQGHAKVSMYRGRTLCTRGVALLVANAFLEDAPFGFTTPIHLNGDLMDCRADNLMWRPRWYAIKYHQQFYLEAFHNDETPRIDLNTNAEYDTLKELCVANGLFYYDVIKACVENTFTPITYQEFADLN